MTGYFFQRSLVSISTITSLMILSWGSDFESVFPLYVYIRPRLSYSCLSLQGQLRLSQSAT